MKKAIKNYLTKLHENEEKGFSLVELIIVMAIMAILVGIVASQVLPYMEKSRQSKDQQQLSSLGTDIVSAIAQSKGPVASFSQKELSACTNGTGETWVDELGSIRSSDGSSIETLANIEKGVVDKFSSKKAKAHGKVYVSYDNSTGVVTVYTGAATLADAKKISSKMYIETE